MSEIIKVKAKAVRKIYGEGTFWIWGMSPIGEFDSNLKIHPVFHNYRQLCPSFRQRSKRSLL